MEATKQYPPFIKPKPMVNYPGMSELIGFLSGTALGSGVFGYHQLRDLFASERLKRMHSAKRKWETIESQYD